MARGTSIERARLGVGAMNPRLSTVRIMLCTDGGVTPKESCRSASAGGLR